ncbi:nitroreductase family protein [Herbivorax sp. ANBcel31]|nr:nitroreductase family protein [Herbivorax sp. ANBcel31]MDQ2086747.1 nitroreductase family protein [Herbivorax sp. ANBcel31]
MSFFKLAQRRFSVRNYKKDSVEEDKLRIILEAGRIAPSSKNSQPQKLIVVSQQDGLDKVKKAANVFNAPIIIIVCGNYQDAWIRSYDQKLLLDIDVTIVTDHMMLTATDLGLGTLWVCNFNPEIIRQEFNLPEYIEPINLLALGYADCVQSSSTKHNIRKSIEETVCYEKYKD